MSKKRTLVIVYEQFFTFPDDDHSVEEAIREGLKSLRMYTGARVVGCYGFDGAAHDKENKKWFAKALRRINLPVETDISID